jgi:hypothetical protein
MRTAPLLVSLLLSLSPPAALADPPFLSPTQRMLSPNGLARLVISRDRDAPNACDVALQVGEQLNARLPVGETLELQVPAGQISLRLSLDNAGYCAQIPLQNAQSILIRPGTTRYYQLVYRDDSLFLSPQTN